MQECEHSSSMVVRSLLSDAKGKQTTNDFNYDASVRSSLPEFITACARGNNGY